MISLLFDIFLGTLCLAGTFCTLLGLFTVIQWMRPSKTPADESNRIGRIRSWWFGLTRPEILASSYRAFRQDELDNVIDVEKAGVFADAEIGEYVLDTDVENWVKKEAVKKAVKVILSRKGSSKKNQMEQGLGIGQKKDS